MICSVVYVYEFCVAFFPGRYVHKEKIMATNPYLLQPFVNLVRTTTSCCPGRHIFKDSDVISFFYISVSNARGNGRPDAHGALRDIAYTQRDNIDHETFHLLCMFFLDHAPRSIINSAIRSMFLCFDIRLRRLRENEDYLDLLRNNAAAQEILRTRHRKDNVRRAALVVLLAHGSYPVLRDYLALESDEKLWILALHSGRYPPFRYASDSIRDNERVISTLLDYNAHEFNLASRRIKDLRPIAMKAATKWGYLLRFLSERLQDDYEIVMIAILTGFGTLEFASPRLKDDYRVVKRAVDIDPHNLRFASERLQTLLRSAN